MAPIRGLKFEVLEDDGDTPCTEYRTADNIEHSKGLTSHHLLRLPLGRFSFRISLDNSQFQWHNANALQLLIDFDNRHHNLEAFILKDPNHFLNPQQLAFQHCRGGRRVFIQGVTRLNHDSEERLTFENTAVEHYGSAATSRRQGTIWVMLKHCTLQSSKVDHTPSPSITTDIQMPNQHILDTAGILSYIRLSSSNRRPIQPRMFKVVSSTTSASFIFHYRTPAEFERIKSLDEDNEVKEINPGVYRISSADPEPVAKQELDKEWEYVPQELPGDLHQPRLPSGDTITLTPDRTNSDSDVDLEDITELLDDIDTKQAELTSLRQQHEEMVASRMAELSKLVEEQKNLQSQYEQDEMAFAEEEQRLEVENKDGLARSAEAVAYRKRKLRELQGELKDRGLALKDLEQENARLDSKMERFKDCMQVLSGRKRRKTSDDKFGP